ncbi:helix-turn-helix transcriptional regulator [Novosphingobium sp.]|uniref:ArsR/SmtB family transcription factor n=1 Tax=Novosphingobium sp. TaxID=1874826 RepID=UPI0027344A67|nr:metalloregulator ArsR/SmtB family transcription factor [Novosphingobium sp.]MDP3907414.1 metalloregulator ArsR/SmtB family transcription factor [Novosphingobium sp.]
MTPSDLTELKSNANRMATRLRIMSHPERLLMLCRMDEGEVSVSELIALTGLSQSAVSQHLAMLRDEDIVGIRAEAQVRFYRLTDPVVRAIIHSLCEICQTSHA